MKTLSVLLLLSVLLVSSCAVEKQDTVGEQETITSNDTTMTEDIPSPEPQQGEEKQSYSFTTDQGEKVVVHPVMHATMVLNWGETTMYVDPAEALESYEAFEKPDMVLVTHEHGDHFNLEVLEALVDENTPFIVNDGVYQKLSPRLQERAQVLKNGETQDVAGYQISAIPAYNIREEALNYHPKGRDNGYILEKDGLKIYISGDSEDTPEMRALQDIDVAFVSMNLPYTMPVENAIDGVLAFAPKTIFPYHFRGIDGMSDVEKFQTEVEIANPDIDVILASWY